MFNLVTVCIINYMNATIHSELSAKRRGGVPEDYYHLHDFIDCSKEVEATNKHRFLTHSMFFVKEAMIPIFGNSIHIANGKPVNMKDMLEQDHIVADYGGKFIPTLNDFVDEIENNADDEQLIMDFQRDNAAFFQEYTAIHRVMTAPLHLTGKIKGLFATHNSWFVGMILPRIFPTIKIEIKNYNISCSTFFNRMNYRKWMQNGQDVPPSFERLDKSKKVRSISMKQVVYDGSLNQTEHLRNQIENMKNHSPISQSKIDMADISLSDDVSSPITDSSPLYYANLSKNNIVAD